MDGQQNERMRGEAEAKASWPKSAYHFSRLTAHRYVLASEAAAGGRNGFGGQAGQGARGKKLPFVKGDIGILRLLWIHRRESEFCQQREIK